MPLILYFPSCVLAAPAPSPFAGRVLSFFVGVLVCFVALCLTLSIQGATFLLKSGLPLHWGNLQNGWDSLCLPLTQPPTWYPRTER